MRFSLLSFIVKNEYCGNITKYTLMTCLLLSTGSSWAKDDVLDMWSGYLIGEGYGGMLSDAVSSAQDMRNASTEFSQSIGAARRQFCDNFPDKPGYKLAAQIFANEMAEKDFYYLTMTVLMGDTPQYAVINAISGGIDGGINPGAQREFGIWVEQMKHYLKENNVGIPSPQDWVNALNSTTSIQLKYRLARDVSEITRCGFKLPPNIYAVTLIQRHRNVQNIEEAVGIYNDMVNAFGEQDVINASSIVSNAPLDSKGKVRNIHQYGLYELGRHGQNDDIAPEGLNPIHINDQYRVMMGILTESNPKAYLLGIINESQYSHDWKQAIVTYNQFVNKFGESEVLSASEKVMNSQKNIRDGLILEPELIGATRIRPYDAFQQIVDPATYVEPEILLEQAAKEAAMREELVKEIRIIEDEYVNMSPLPDNHTIADLCRRYSDEAYNGPEFSRCMLRFDKLIRQGKKTQRKQNNTTQNYKYSK